MRDRLQAAVLLSGALIGRLTLACEYLWRRHRRRAGVVLILSVAAYLSPRAVLRVAEFCSRLPAISAGTIIGTFAAGFFLLGLAAFVYVLFRFLYVIVQADALLARDIASARETTKGFFSMGSRAKPKATDGVYVDDDEDYYHMQEQLSDLQSKGILKGQDLKDLMKEGHHLDIDFEKLKKSARGVSSD